MVMAGQENRTVFPLVFSDDGVKGRKEEKRCCCKLEMKKDKRGVRNLSSELVSPVELSLVIVCCSSGQHNNNSNNNNNIKKRMRRRRRRKRAAEPTTSFFHSFFF